MQRPICTLGAVLVASALVMLAPAGAGAQIAWAPCGDSNDFACGHLTVPLDPGVGPEVLTLAMRRHLAPVGGASEAVIALAGGPGQAAIPFTGEFDALLGPILGNRDLIVFDQRGIGLSHPLSCSAFEHLANAQEPPPKAVAVCASQIGASRGFYETADTVADIEAIRQAGGYSKLVLYGTSYGTKVAERYAQLYPGRVSALVLDSVVPPNGPEALHRSTFTAIRSVLRGLCAAHACARITHDPVRDLSRLVGLMRSRPLRGRTIDGHGHAHTLRVSSEDLLGVLYAGDFDPLLRAEFPAAVRSALEGDRAALARMVARAEASGEPIERESLTEGFDIPLYYATTCEEQAFPFDRSASVATRRAQALAYARAQPASTFAPFAYRDALASSDIGPCSEWPFAAPGPEAGNAPLPGVPTLIFSGEDDIRTPTADARALAAQIPGAQLVTVPHTGHSVLTSSLSDCPRKALQAFFAGTPVKPCTGGRPSPTPRPAPLAPRRLAKIAPAPGTRGRAGKALGAVLLTLRDFSRQAALELIVHVAGKRSLGLLEIRIGGLRAGWGDLSEGSVTLHDYTYVPGLPVSGRLSSGHGTLHVGGSAGVRGVLHLGAHDTLSGTLGGRRVSGREPIALL